MQASLFQFWLPLLLALASGGAGLYFGLRYLAQARLIENTPTARIRSAPQGYVELDGIALPMAGEPIHAPLTGAPCCWYRIKVEKRGERSWIPVEKATSGHLFLLRDPTGDCVVDPDDAHVIPSDRAVWYGTTPRPMPANRGFDSGRQSLLLRVARALNQGVAFGTRYRYTEERIFPGDPLYAIGMFRTIDELDRRQHRRELMLGILRDWKRDPDALLERFDRDRNGRIDPEEWEQARRQAADEAAGRVDDDPHPPLPHRIGAPDDGRPYLLSSTPEETLVRRLRWRMAIALLVTAGSLWMVLRLLQGGHA